MAMLELLALIFDLCGLRWQLMQSVKILQHNSGAFLPKLEVQLD